MKRFVTFILCIAMVLSISMPVFAFSAAADESEQTQTEAMEAEVLEWRYRNNYGILERRLWSITYGVWRTEWEAF